METRPVEPVIRLVSSVVRKWLIGSVVAVVLAGTAVQLIRFYTGHDSIYGLVPLFDLGMEANIPTFYSSLLLLCSSVLLTVISSAAMKSGSRFAKQWVVLAVGFFYLAVDESAHIHELLIQPMRNLLGSYSQGIFYFAWVVPGIGIVAALAFFFFSLLRSLDRVTRWYFLVGGFLYVGGAVGIEMVDGLVAARYGKDILAYNLLVVVEETMEMSGVIVFIAGLLRYLKHHSPKAVLEVS
jgi:hypothetical protein